MYSFQTRKIRLILCLLLQVCVQRAFAQLTSAQDAYRQGLTAYQAGDYTRALALFQSAEQMAPTSPVPLEAAASCYFKLGNDSAALVLYQRAGTLAPQDAKITSTIDWLRRRIEASHLHPSPPRTAASDFRSPHGLFGSIYVPVDTVGGGFNGSTLLLSTISGEYVAVPNVSDAGLGFGLDLGWRGFGGILEPVSLEGSYQQVLCNVAWNGATGQADYYVVEMTLRYSFLADQPFQFSLLAGPNLSRLWVKGGSLYQQQVGDTTYDMQGFHFGAGVSYFIAKNMDLYADVMVRTSSAFNITAADGITQDAVYDLHGDGVGFKMGTTFYPF